MGTPSQNVVVGRVEQEGFVPVAGLQMIWPGGTTKIPQVFYTFKYN